MTRLRCLLTVASLGAAAALPAAAQISFTTAIDLALKNNPRVLGAQAEVEKAKFELKQTKDVYIPTLSVGSGIGYTYGFPFGAPSLFNITSQSLIFDQSQANYIRSARAGLEAANHHLGDVRQQVMEDAAITYITLDADSERIKAAVEESNDAAELTKIVQQRLDAGQDTPVELTRSKLTAANLRLRQIQLEDDAGNQREHLARLTGLPSDNLRTEHETIPSLTGANFTPVKDTALPESIRAAYSAAESKLQAAFGDDRKLYRPQIGLGVQYSRLASFNNYKNYYNNFDNYNNVQIGLQFNLPLFDRSKRDKAHESLAEAQRSRYEADAARNQFLEGRFKMSQAVRELEAKLEVAQLERELASNQIDVVRIQLRDGSPNGQPVTPKEEQNARIQERARYLDFLDTDFQLHQTEINLLRANGQLENWLHAAIQSEGISASKPQ
ncbi:MAG: TolC family protein [Edaphobacter sp.]|uniref:TolC family protein n=1 Tax=Edaphobacter sp. TaxID=1934404 RepID=UPI0023A3F5B0|nr:TolC family protein [Edaphobacter sp.]MDE1176292.1 TolC family protein [Edaphobacter sp.]